MEGESERLAQSFIWGWIIAIAGLLTLTQIMVTIGAVMVVFSLVGGAIATYVE